MVDCLSVREPSTTVRAAAPWRECWLGLVTTVLALLLMMATDVQSITRRGDIAIDAWHQLHFHKGGLYWEQGSNASFPNAVCE